MKIVMTGSELVLARKKLGLGQLSMAGLLCESLDSYKRWEKKGLRAPHDHEGPAAKLVRVMINCHLSKRETRDLIGYAGPEKKFAGIPLLYKK